MLFNLLIVVGTGVLAWSLRTFANPVLFKLGTLCIFATSFFAGWLFTGHLWAGGVCATLLLFAPWVEILKQIRPQRIPLRYKIESRPPPSPHDFPMLEDLTGEIEDEGFEHVGDLGWKKEDGDYFFRVFLHPKTGVRGLIGLVSQPEFSFFYFSVYSYEKGTANRQLTWNFPFSSPMLLPKKWKVQKVFFECDFAYLFELHAREFFEGFEEVPAEEDGRLQELGDELEKAFDEQVEENLRAGIFVEAEDSTVRYTFRGMMFLWVQFLKELVRF